MASPTTEACEDAMLTFLASESPESVSGIVDSYVWAVAHTWDPQVVIGAANSLLTEGYIETSPVSTSFYTLSAEATSILKEGSQEFRVLEAVTAAGKLTMEALQAQLGADVSKIGMGNCLKNKWVQKDGSDLVPAVSLADVQDSTQMALKALADGDYSVDAIDEKVRRWPDTYTSASMLLVNLTNQFVFLERPHSISPTR
jgi:phenylalanyl-tRNA synthetase alpha chain